MAKSSNDGQTFSDSALHFVYGQIYKCIRTTDSKQKKWPGLPDKSEEDY